MYRIALLLVAALMLSGCAVPFYHFDSDAKWVGRKEEAFAKAHTPWKDLKGAPHLALPNMLAEYFGDNFKNIERYDYFHGYVYARRQWSTIPWWKKYLPFGIYSFETMGIIGSNKEWSSRPSLEAFVIQIGITVGTSLGGVVLLAPTRVRRCFTRSSPSGPRR